MKFKKFIKRALCILLACLVLVVSPVSKYLDTQQIETVEGAEIAIPFLGGLGLLYILSQTLGFDIGTLDAVNIQNGFCEYVEKLDTLDDTVAQKITSLILKKQYGADVELAGIGSQLISVLLAYLNSKEYDNAGYFNETVATTGYEVCQNYDADLSQGMYYDRLPVGYKTALMGETIDSYIEHWEYPREKYFTLYSPIEDCYYMSNINRNSAEQTSVSNYDHTDAYWDEYVMFADGLYLVAFDENEMVTDISPVTLTKYVYSDEYGIYKSNNFISNDPLFVTLIFDYFQVATNYCNLAPLTITKVGWDALGYSNKDWDLLSNYQDEGYVAPSLPNTIVKHGVTNPFFVDRLADIFTFRTSRLVNLANAYDTTMADAYVMGLTDYFPSGEQEDTEQKLITDVFPVADDVLDDADTDDNTGTDDDTDTGTEDDATTDVPDTDTDTETSGFWATLFEWLKKIYNSTYYTYSYSKTISETLTDVKTSIEQTVVGALANIGVYDIDIWDTAKSILDNMFTLDALTNALAIPQNTDRVISGLGDLSDTVANVREGIDILIGKEIGQYDIDILNTLSAIDKILTNGIVLDGEDDFIPGLVDGIIDSIEEATRYLSDVRNEAYKDRLNSDTIESALLNVKDKVLTLPADIANALIEALTGLLEALFVPDTAELEVAISDLRYEFEFADTLICVWEDIMNRLYNSDKAPTIYIHFENSEDAKFQSVGKMKAIDFEWYEPYKPYGDAIVSAILWAFFLLRLIKDIPNIIRGISDGGGSVNSNSADVPFSDGIGGNQPRIGTRGFKL